MSRAAAAALAVVLSTSAVTGLGATSGSDAHTLSTAGAVHKVRTTNGCISSVPEPGSATKVRICYTLFRPAGASAKHRVPMLMHSHGWSGSRVTSAEDDEVRRFIRAGYGVLSFDQRGWGESGGHAHVENPTLEGRDVRRLIRLIGKLRWVRQDAKNDPRLGAIGGSYGGGFQFLGAFESLRTRGKPIFDALAPQITWYDVSRSLAPEGVPRTPWALSLAAGSLISDALTPTVYEALVEGALTADWPDGSGPLHTNMRAYFKRNGPSWHVRHGRRLDIPVLLGQGTTDTLFPLQQGLANWRKALTPRARRHSIFVGYNGGHTLPAVFPRGINVESDPCSRQLGGGDFTRLTLRFFDKALRGQRTKLRGYGRLHIATPASKCHTVTTARARRSYDVGKVSTTTAVGLPLPYRVAEGPIRVVGTPFLTGKVTARGVDNRAFYGLAVGKNRLDAKLVQNNVLPINEPRSVTGVKRRVDLPSVAVDIPKGENLYLMVTAFSDTFPLMGSRTPGSVVINDATVHLPVPKH